VRVLEGHPFVVEAAVSLGGRDIRPGINVYRFANRIPLLFEVTPVMVQTAASRQGTLCECTVSACSLRSSQVSHADK